MTVETRQPPKSEHSRAMTTWKAWGGKGTGSQCWGLGVGEEPGLLPRFQGILVGLQGRTGSLERGSSDCPFPWGPARASWGWWGGGWRREEEERGGTCVEDFL